MQIFRMLNDGSHGTLNQTVEKGSCLAIDDFYKDTKFLMGVERYIYQWEHKLHDKSWKDIPVSFSLNHFTVLSNNKLRSQLPKEVEAAVVKWCREEMAERLIEKINSNLQKYGRVMSLPVRRKLLKKAVERLVY